MCARRADPTSNLFLQFPAPLRYVGRGVRAASRSPAGEVPNPLTLHRSRLTAFPQPKT
ncbi:hypothetical protein Lfu02_77720 [Longispora fulva]|nr:hypothetical protein Lfu02_77720 [Longispora fulva]